MFRLSGTYIAFAMKAGRSYSTQSENFLRIGSGVCVTCDNICSMEVESFRFLHSAGHRYQVKGEEDALVTDFRVDWFKKLSTLVSATGTQPVFVVVKPRCGSTLFMDFLNSHSEISAFDEIYNARYFANVLPLNESDPQKSTEKIETIVRACDKKICAFKINFNLCGSKNGLQELINFFPSALFVFLYRQDLVNQYASMEIVKKTGIWHLRNPFNRQDSIPKIHFDKVVFQRWATDLRAQLDSMYSLLSDIDSHRLLIATYEQLASHPQDFFDQKVLPFLGVDNQEISSNLLKINSQSKADIIQNFDEIESWLRTGEHLISY